MASTVWIVAQVKTVDDQGWAKDWDLGGVFTTEQKARDACSQPLDAMWPVTLDEVFGRETQEPPGITYPAVQTQE